MKFLLLFFPLDIWSTLFFFFYWLVLAWSWTWVSDCCHLYEKEKKKGKKKHIYKNWMDGWLDWLKTAFTSRWGFSVTHGGTRSSVRIYWLRSAKTPLQSASRVKEFTVAAYLWCFECVTAGWRSARSYERNVKHRPLCSRALNSNQLHNKFDPLVYIMQSRLWVTDPELFVQQKFDFTWLAKGFFFSPFQERKCVLRDFFFCCFECSGFSVLCLFSKQDGLFILSSR